MVAPGLLLLGQLALEPPGLSLTVRFPERAAYAVEWRVVASFDCEKMFMQVSDGPMREWRLLAQAPEHRGPLLPLLPVRV